MMSRSSLWLSFLSLLTLISLLSPLTNAFCFRKGPLLQCDEGDTESREASYKAMMELPPSPILPELWGENDGFTASLELFDRISEYIASKGFETHYNSDSKPNFDEANDPESDGMTTDGGDLSNLTNSNTMSKDVNYLDAEILSESMEVVKEAIEHYSPAGVIAAFNGGKDATIVLVLYIVSLANFYRVNNTPYELRHKPRAVHFQKSDEFEEILNFVNVSISQYGVQMLEYDGSYAERIGDCIADIRLLNKNGFLESVSSGPVESESLFEEHFGPSDSDSDEDAKNRVHTRAPHPSTCDAAFEESRRELAFVLGVRRVDTPKTLYPYHPSTLQGTQFMRIHPLLDWSYGMIWDFFDRFAVPYCSLYDKGYTSLGALSDTIRNERLKIGNGEAGEGQFVPARFLKEEEWELERSARSV